jgi:hypothetical protein
MALDAAGGIAQNTSLKHVDLEALVDDPLHIMISGIGGPASSIESFSTSFQRPNHAEVGLGIARVLHVTPSLKTLVVYVEVGRAGESASHDAWMDQVIYSLREPFCAQVEELVLGGVCLDLERSTMSIADSVSSKNHIHCLKVLHLYSVVFGDAKSLCLFF